MKYVLARSTAAAILVTASSLVARPQSGCAPSLVFDVFPAQAPTTNYYFGRQTALSGDGRYLVVGAPAHMVQGVDTGVAWVIDLQTPGGAAEALLQPATLMPCQGFGHSAAISYNGNVVIVGSYPQCGTLGRVRIYRRMNGMLTPTLNLTGVSQDMFGLDVSVSGDGNTVVVSSPLWFSGMPDRGAIFTFDWTGSTWVQSSALFPHTIPLGVEGIGNNVELSGDGQTLAFSTPWHQLDTVRTGVVYVMRRNGAGWVHQARLKEPVQHSTGGFGLGLAISHDGNIVAAGNPDDSRLAQLQGAVTIFRCLQSGWGYDNVILPTTYSNGTSFGGSVAMNAIGTQVVAGGASHAGGLGLVENFTAPAIPGVPWTPVLSYVPTAPGPLGAGKSVSMNASGARWVAGELRSDVYGPDAGRVLVFEAPCLNPTIYCTAQTNSLGCAAQITAQGAPSVSSPSGYTISASNVRNQQNGMLIYGTNGRAQIPWQGGTLCVGMPLRRTPLVNSGGAPAPTLNCSGVLARDFNAWAIAANDPTLFAGQTVQAQFYSRDPGAFANINLSNALEFVLEP